MSLHWTLIAGFLYAEIAVILLLLLPFVSNRAWNKLFKSKFLKGLENQVRAKKAQVRVRHASKLARFCDTFLLVKVSQEPPEPNAPTARPCCSL